MPLAAAIAALATRTAAGALPDLDGVGADVREVGGYLVFFGRVLHLAIGADGSHQPLRHHTFDGAGHEERLDAHVDQDG